jgi:universal stress protein E
MSDADRLMLIAPSILKKTPAFARAQALAKAQDAPLHIVAFDYVDGLATAGMVDERTLEDMREGYLDRHRQWLEQLALPMRHVGIHVTTEVVWVQRPLDELIEHIRELKPSLVIKDLEHESWLSRILFTSLDVRLLHDSPVPLHLVADVEHPLPRRIVAAVDPFRPEEQYEGLNESIIAAANKLATQCNAELHLLYAYDLSYIFAAEGDMDFTSEILDSVYATEWDAFDLLASRYGVPDDRKHMVLGSPSRVITAFARSGAVDVTVMGTVHRGPGRKWLGSATEHVAHHLHGSLLAVNPRQLGW